MSERRVVTRSPLNVKGYFNSIKCACAMPWETPLERDAMLILEFDPHVTAFKQHQRATYIDDSMGGFTTFPDIEYVHSGRQCVLEVKRDIDLQNVNLQHRLQRIKGYFLAVGIDYQVWNTTVIRREPRLSNLKDLAYHRFRGGTAHLRGLTQIAPIVSGQQLTLGDIAGSLGSWSAALTLVANDILVVDINQPLTPLSTVQMAGGRHGTI
jgi:hypothetical protein